jgi:hypothetical protein
VGPAVTRNRLPHYRALARGALTDNADLVYRHSLTFGLGPHDWVTRCSVKDPQRLRPDAVGRLQALASTLNLPFADLRVLSVHPADPWPFPGATCSWDDGTLEILEWAQASDFTGTRTGTAVLRRP